MADLTSIAELRLRAVIEKLMLSGASRKDVTELISTLIEACGKDDDDGGEWEPPQVFWIVSASGPRMVKAMAGPTGEQVFATKEDADEAVEWLNKQFAPARFTAHEVLACDPRMPELEGWRK